MLQGDEWCGIECRITDQLIITKSWRWTLSLTNSPSRRLLPCDKVFAVIPGLVISQEMAPLQILDIFYSGRTFCVLFHTLPSLDPSSLFSCPPPPTRRPGPALCKTLTGPSSVHLRNLHKTARAIWSIPRSLRP